MSSKENCVVEFSEDKAALTARMYNLLGKRWTLIAGRIPGKTAEEIEHYCTSMISSRKNRVREFSEDEELIIAKMFKLLGKRWALIAGRIPGRNAEEIEHYWTSKLKSNLLGKNSQKRKNHSLVGCFLGGRKMAFDRRKDYWKNTTTY